MKPVEELHALYEQWRLLTQEEGRGIERADWEQVALSQAGKSRLQPRIVEVSQRIEAAVHELQFRPVVDQLIMLERTNRELLERQRDAGQQRKQELDRSSRQLKQLHKSYVPPGRPNWHSYS